MATFEGQEKKLQQTLARCAVLLSQCDTVDRNIKKGAAKIHDKVNDHAKKLHNQLEKQPYLADPAVSGEYADALRKRNLVQTAMFKTRKRTWEDPKSAI